MSRTPNIIPAALLTAGLVCMPAAADQIVHFGGPSGTNYLDAGSNNQTAPFIGQVVMNNLNRDGDGNNDDNGFGVPFQNPTTGSAISPTAFHYATAGTDYEAGPAFFGGFEFIAYNTTAPTEQAKNGVADPALAGNSSLDPDRINVRGRYNANHDTLVDTGEAAGVILFPTATSSTLGIGSQVQMIVEAADGSLAGRIVVQSNGNFYISKDTITYTNTAAPVTINFDFTAGTQFYAYDPATALNFDQINPGAAISGLFTNVTAVGYYFENDDIQKADFNNASNADLKLEVSDFTVNAQSVPEPASVILFGSGLSLFAIRRRNHH